MDTSGIYAIENTLTGERYVGSSVNMRKRWNVHKTYLRQGRHPNHPLQQVVQQHGVDVLLHVVLEEVPEARLIEREQHWFDTLQPEYNLRSFARSTGGLGKKVSEETKARMREVQSNRSPEWRARISAGKMGHEVSAETREKISTTLKKRNAG